MEEEMRHKWDSKRSVSHCVKCGMCRDKRYIPVQYSDKNGRYKSGEQPNCIK